MSKNKPGKYWDATLNMARHIDCRCECGDKCWWKQQQKRFNQPLGWFPEQANKVSTTGKAKVYAVQWLGDIAFLDREKVCEIIEKICDVNWWRDGVNGGYTGSGRQLKLEPHKYLILTKWPEILFDKLSLAEYENFPHVYIGISASDQKTFDQRIPGLLKFDGFKKWVSLEPLYGEIDIIHMNHVLPHLDRLDQVIVGGETGGKYKANIDCYRSIRDQCQAAGVPFFIKHIDKANGRTLDRIEHNELIWGNHGRL